MCAGHWPLFTPHLGPWRLQPIVSSCYSTERQKQLLKVTQLGKWEGRIRPQAVRLLLLFFSPIALTTLYYRGQQTTARA